MLFLSFFVQVSYVKGGLGGGIVERLKRGRYFHASLGTSTIRC